MRRLCEQAGTAIHRHHIQFHAARCKGVSPLHDELSTEATAVFALLRDRARACEDAKDGVIVAKAVCDRAETTLEDAIRDLDAEARKCDRKNPSLAAQGTIFPKGFGEEIEPEGDEQLSVLPALKVRIAPLLNEPAIAAAAANVDTAEKAFRDAIKARKAAEETRDEKQAEETNARAAVRAQLDSAYGRLRAFYKHDPRKAEAFFWRERQAKSAEEEEHSDQPELSAEKQAGRSP